MASFKELFEIGQDYDSFVGGGLDTETIHVNTIQKRIKSEDLISHSTFERLAGVVGNYRLLIASEMWCPDCLVSIPALNYMCLLQSRISLSIISKARAEHQLQHRLDLDKILVPVIAVLNFNFELVGRYGFVVRSNSAQVLSEYKEGYHIEEILSHVIDIIERFEGRSGAEG